MSCTVRQEMPLEDGRDTPTVPPLVPQQPPSITHTQNAQMGFKCTNLERLHTLRVCVSCGWSG